MTSTQTIPEADRSPTLADVIREAMNSRLRSLHVALPGRVESYDAAEQKADVQPLIQELLPRRDGTELPESLPCLPNVPIVFPRGGGYFLTFPIKAGDHVLLIFNERSIDAWVNDTGRERNPDDFRTHALSDAVAIPGFFPFQKAVAESGIDANMVLGRDGGSTIHVKDNGEVHVGGINAADFLAQAKKVIDNFDAIKAVFDSHIHLTTATIGAGPTPGVIAAPAAGFPTTAPVATIKLKAD